MANITGNDSANILNGTTGADTITGLGGNDTIYGKEGDDVILGGAGNDILYGDAGTDTVKGDDGNDVVKGGTGKAFLYGGNGDDSVFYDPTTSNVSAVKDYLSPSILKGDAGNDTLSVYNNAKATVGGVEGASKTVAYVNDDGFTYLYFTDKNGSYENQINVGTASGFETMKFVGAGGVEFYGDTYGNAPSRVEGTAASDTFYSSYFGSDTFKGNGGNDKFHIGGGDDKIISETNDADLLYFYGGNGDSESDATVQGFTGAGQQAGDKLYLSNYYFTDANSQVTESGGNTVFTLNTGESLTILGATGLIEGVDWFV